MTRRCHQCTADIYFKETQIKKDDKIILNILKNISGSKELAGSHAHNLLEVIKENDAENISMPPLCGKCSVSAYDELNRQLTELEMEGNAYEETLCCLQESNSTSPYNSDSNQTEINECDEEIEKLENELKLLEFEETKLKWEVDDVTKRENETSKEYDELFRGWKAGQRSLISRNELLHSLNNQNLYYLSQNERLKSPDLMNAIAGTFKKPVFDPCDKLVFN